MGLTFARRRRHSSIQFYAIQFLTHVQVFGPIMYLYKKTACIVAGVVLTLHVVVVFDGPCNLEYCTTV